MFNIWLSMTPFDKAGTFLDCGQAVDYDGVYLLRMDLQSLVMNLPAFALCFVFLQCSLHGREVFSGTVHYPKGQEIESRARMQHLSHEPHMEADAQAESVCMDVSLFLAAL